MDMNRHQPEGEFPSGYQNHGMQQQSVRHPLAMDGSLPSSYADGGYPPNDRHQPKTESIVNITSVGSRDSGIGGLGASTGGDSFNNGQYITRRVPPPVYQARKKNCCQRRCSICIQLCKWLPVLFIVAVLSWGWYAFVIQLSFFTIESVIARTLLLVIFNFLLMMVFWSYYQTIFTEPGSVPQDFWLTVDELDAINREPTEEGRRVRYEFIVESRRLPVYARTYNGGFRTCEKCNLIKPDRAHHCSVCDACILKMDHHCPWVNNCVSFTNYKFFVLFLGYSFCLCLFAAASAFPSFLRFWRNDLGSNYGKLHILFLFFVSIMFAISLASLFFYHIFLTLRNRSTLESFRTPVFRYGPDKKAYDLGKSRNFQEIFGDSIFHWFLPITTSRGDGIVFENRHDKSSRLHDLSNSPNESRNPLLADVDDHDGQEVELGDVIILPSSIPESKTEQLINISLDE